MTLNEVPSAGVSATVGYLMATGIKDTGVYYLTPWSWRRGSSRIAASTTSA